MPGHKNEDHFLMPTTPQNGAEHVCFVRVSLLGGFQANFGKSHFYSRFGAVFTAIWAVEENKPALELNFPSKHTLEPGLYFYGLGAYLNEPYLRVL